MEKHQTITLDNLNKYTVSVVTETYVNIDGKMHMIERNRLAYSNSPLGRLAVTQDIPENYASAIFSVWGTTTTLVDPEPPVMR